MKTKKLVSILMTLVMMLSVVFCAIPTASAKSTSLDNAFTVKVREPEEKNIVFARTYLAEDIFVPCYKGKSFSASHSKIKITGSNIKVFATLKRDYNTGVNKKEIKIRFLKIGTAKINVYFQTSKHTYKKSLTLFVSLPIRSKQLVPYGKKTITLSKSDKLVFQKILYSEAFDKNFETRTYVGSCLLNNYSAYCHKGKKTLSFKKFFSNDVVLDAPWYKVNNKKAKTMESTANYILSGGRVPKIKYFRSDYYHSFGTPVIHSENMYFSK